MVVTFHGEEIGITATLTPYVSDKLFETARAIFQDILTQIGTTRHYQNPLLEF